jgi:hypothetical protein
MIAAQIGIEASYSTTDTIPLKCLMHMYVVGSTSSPERVDV